MQLTSSAFQAGQPIPPTYTQEGEDSSPPLAISDVPPEAKSLVLFVEDPDTSRGTLTHWIVFNIDPGVGVILDNSIPLGANQGTNFSGTVAYHGPKPPSGTHRYFFRLYALDTKLALKEGANRPEIERAMAGHVLATAELMGRYTAGSSLAAR